MSKLIEPDTPTSATRNGQTLDVLDKVKQQVLFLAR